MREINEKKYSAVNIADISAMAENDPEDLVRRSEEYYNNQVARAAGTIREGKETTRPYKYILLCGPSASGKTTTAHKLKQRLIDQGVGARVLSMDNFFKGMMHYPKLANGSPDMESVHCLDLDLLNESFSELTRRGNSWFPQFDFNSQEQRLRSHYVELGDNDVLIMEGIHALNPMVLSSVPPQTVFRIYVSVRTKFVEGDEKVLVPKDIRLLRRMVRDSKFRNYPAVYTLRYWDTVVAGEKKNIDPFRDDVDLKIDNTIDYEACVWHHLLREVIPTVGEEDFEEFPQMERVLTALGRFPAIDPNLIPSDSLLREFIG
ncbi:MAG: nucleoside kinase [Oscillospiraceae bacterium]|nr:nucleoside kinase [Oscillospiraceae bacterium]